MGTTINRFIKLNKQLFRNDKFKKTIALVNRERPEQALEGSIVVSALANKNNLNIIVITDFVYKNITKIFKSFGLSNFFLVSDFKNYFSNPVYTLIACTKLFNTIYFILFFGFKKFIREFNLKGILVGDLIYDSYIRNNLSFVNPKIDLKFLKICFIAYFKILKLNKFYQKKNIKYLIVHTDCYAKNEALSIRIAWKNNIKVFKLLSTKNKIFLVESLKHELISGFRPIHKYFSKKKLNKIVSLKMKQFDSILEKRFGGTINSVYTNQIDLKNANKIKTHISGNLFVRKLFKKSIKFERIILFAPHAFSDAPHHFGTFLFRDYWDQFVQSINYFKKDQFKNILWLIRPHPSSYMYNETNLINNYIKNFSDNIKFCDANLISTRNLIQICDTVVTGRGTVGLEFACFGKKPILAGASTYSKYGITFEPKSIADYFESFSKSKTFEPLSEEQKLTARKILFYIENLYPKHLNPKFDNLILNGKEKSLLGVLKEKNKVFSNNFLNLLKANKFEDDLIYKYFFNNGKYL